jgi:large subunit ribosomal protein L1
MAKADLLQEAAALNLSVTAKNTIAEIQEAIDGATQENTETISESRNEEVKTAKAGKRSAKGLEEAEAKAEKLEHQKHRDEEAAAAEKPKQPVKPTRSRLERRGKAYRKAAELVEKGKVYSLKEAMDLAAKTSAVKFDASVELHINLGVDPRQADQNIRANLVLPQGTGKTVRVAVFADEQAENADLSGIEAITKDLEKGVISFDVLVSTPANMAKLGKYARLLGPRGLMPNPKSGTVTTDVNKAVAEAKAGKVEYRVDSTGIVHLAVGKVSFGGAKLLENANAVMASIRAAKPASVKGNYIKAVHATTSMGPSITVSTNELTPPPELTL